MEPVVFDLGVAKTLLEGGDDEFTVFTNYAVVHIPCWLAALIRLFGRV